MSIRPAAHEGFGDHLIPNICAAATDPDALGAREALMTRYRS